MMTFFRKRLFWLLQTFGWGGLGLITIVSAGQHDNILGLLLLFGSVLFSGFVGSSILGWFLKRYVSIDSFSLKKLLLTFTGILVATGIYFALSSFSGFLLSYFSAKLDFPETGFNFDNERANFAIFFFGFMLMAIWAVLYLGIKLLMKYNDERIGRLKLREEVKQARLNTLKGHINPQFMASTLKEIKKLMLTDVPRSRAMLTELSELLRYSLTKNNIDGIPLNEELEMVKTYFELITINRPGTLKTAYKISPEVLNTEIPPMLLLNLIELGTKHKILNEGFNNFIHLKAAIQNSKLKLEVVSDFRIKATEESKFIENKIRQQLRLLFQRSADFEHRIENEQNTTSIVLPFEYN